MSKNNYNPDWIPPPGATVEDLLSRSSVADPLLLIARHLGHERAEKLVDGQLPIDLDIARLLASKVGLSVTFWLERERLYRTALAQRHVEKQLLSELPLDEMRKRALIKPLYSHAEEVAEVVEFFGKNDFESCREHVEHLPELIKQKTSQTIASRPGALAVWIRAGELEASQTECASWSAERLRGMLPEFRKLTRTEDPRKYLPALKTLCQDCGIAFVVLRALNGCRARGAVKFISPEKVMLLVSYRHLRDDQFWFSFFHELAHLLLHADGGTVVDDDWDDSVTREEVEADQFAADVLIPPQHQSVLLSLRDDRSIIQFARRVGVSRGVVVGQMQYKKIIGFESFNHLKTHYRWGDADQVERKPRGT
jgi:HTH-type transcriptional regulator / antitoxin HigA